MVESKNGEMTIGLALQGHDQGDQAGGGGAGCGHGGSFCQSIKRIYVKL